MRVSSSEIIEKYIPRDRVDRYLDEVEKANRSFNLYSRNLTRADLKTMVAESLIPVELGWVGADSEKVIDIGSGWGIPAIPLLLAKLPTEITMVERSRKKADFLELLLRRLHIAATVTGGDPVTSSHAAQYGIVTVRGVAIEEKLQKALKSIADASSRIIYFGPDFPQDLFGDPQYIDYTIDKLPARRLWTAKIS